MHWFVHDQGPLAWFVVAGYLIAAFLAFRAGSATAGRERGFWLATGIVMVLLGINKQLDLQSDLTDFARAAAHSEGWYGWRRDVQGLFLLLMALGAAAIAMVLWRWLRDSSHSAKLAAIGPGNPARLHFRAGGFVPSHRLLGHDPDWRHAQRLVAGVVGDRGDQLGRGNIPQLHERVGSVGLAAEMRVRPGRWT